MPRTVPQTTQTMKRPRRRRVAMLAAGALGLAALAAPAAQATVGVPNSGIGVHGPLDGATDFPTYYQDADGMQLVPCVSAAACGPAAAPVGNFFDEAFYWSGSAAVGNNSLTLAQEATFDDTPNGQAVFGRIRIRNVVGDLIPNAWYRYTTPYGAKDLQADDDGKVNDTVDAGCGPAIGTDCLDALGADANYGAAADSEVGPNFLQWDQSATGGGDPPSGFIADANVEHKIVGSRFYPAGETTPANFFRVERVTGPGGAVIATVGQSDLFTIQGQLNAGPVGQLVNSSGDAGNQRLGTTGSKTVTFTNAGGGALDLGTVTLSGVDPGEGFTLGATTCAGATLNKAATCTVTVNFAPTTTGTKAAAITITDTDGVGVASRDYPLLGVGTQSVASAPGSVNFGSQILGGAVQRIITVSNTGTAPLNIGSASLVGAAGQYTLGNNLCAGASVAPNGSCTVEVFFTPTAGGPQNATLQVNTDGGNRSVALTGTGVAGAAPAPTPAGGGGIVGPGPGPAAGSSTLTLSQLSMSSRIKRSKVRRQGLRLVARLQNGTEVLRIRVYRKKRNGTRTLISQGYRAPSASGLYRTSLKAPKLRRDLSVGSYELEVTPGRSIRNLGTPAKYAFRVVK